MAIQPDDSREISKNDLSDHSSKDSSLYPFQMHPCPVNAFRWYVISPEILSEIPPEAFPGNSSAVSQEICQNIHPKPDTQIFSEFCYVFFANSWFASNISERTSSNTLTDLFSRVFLWDFSEHSPKNFAKHMSKDATTGEISVWKVHQKFLQRFPLEVL